MKFKIACILMFTVAAQAQFIDGYAGHALPTATPVQWLPQNQPFPSNFYVQPTYYYRDTAGNRVHSWAYYNPIVQVDGNTVQVGATVEPKSITGPVRTKRQIQLRYSNAGGRSLNDRSLFKDDAALVAAPIRKERQIQLRYRNSASRRGRSVNEISSLRAGKFNKTPVRNERQILLRYRNNARRRIGRSLNEPSFICPFIDKALTKTGTLPTRNRAAR